MNQFHNFFLLAISSLNIFIISQKKDLGYTEIELTVAPENQIAIDLYKKHGYKQESFLKDEYGTGVDRFMMKKIL